MGAKFSMRSNGPVDQVVEVDGRDISSAVSKVRISAAAGHVTEVELTLPIIELEAVGDDKAKVFLAAGCHDLLVQLGWTPPAEETP